MTTRISHLQISGNIMLGRDTVPRMTWVSPQTRTLGAFRLGDAINILFQASGKNLTAPITYSVVVGSIPDGTTLNPTTGRLQGVATDQQGLAEFTIRAQSNSSFIDHEFRIVLGDHPSPVWITPAGLITFGEYNQEVEMGLALEAQDPYELPIQYLINGGALPPGVFLDTNTGVISGTYPILPEDQEFEFTVSASNGDTGSLRTFSIYVAGLPQVGAPIWLTPPGEVGDPYELSYFSKTLKAIDLEGDEITYIRVAGNIPPFLTLDGNTGVLSGTLDNVTDNTEFKFIIGAKTPDLLVTKRIFTVLVKFDPAPAFTYPPGPVNLGNGIEGENFYYDIGANAVSNPELQRTFTSVDLPTGFFLDTTTGELTSPILPLVSSEDDSEELNFSVNMSDGLKETVQTFTFTLRKDLPPIWLVTGNSIGDAYAETYIETFHPLAYDMWGRPVVYSLDANTPVASGMSFDGNDGKIYGYLPPSPVEDVIYPVTITATSGAHPATRDFTYTGWHNEPPIWDSQSDLGQIIEDYPSPFVVIAHDEHFVQTVTYRLTAGALPGAMTLDQNTGVISGVAPHITDPDFEVFDFTIEASYNGILPTTKEFSIRVVKDYPPEWDTPPGDIMTVLGLKNFTVSVMGHDNNETPITYVLIHDDLANAGFPDIASNEGTATISGKFPLANTPTTYTQRWGLDDGKNPLVTRDFTFTVLPNLLPVWNTVANTVVIDDFERTEVSYQLDAYDPEGENIIFWYSIGSSQLIHVGNTVLSLLSNGLITGTLPPVTEDTEYSFFINAWDNTGSENNVRYRNTPQLIRVISRFNTPPVWQTNPNLFEIENHAFSMNLVATGVGNLPQMFYSLVDGELPPGITFYSNGALIGQTPDVSNDTAYQFTVNAFNGIKSTDRTFTFTVLNNVPPVWDTPAGEVANSLGQVPFEATISGHDPNAPYGDFYMMLVDRSNVPNSVVFTLDNSPPDVNNVYITGHISGTFPISETDVTYSFTAAIWDGVFPPENRTFTLRNIENQDPIWSTPEGLLAVRREEKFITLAVSASDPEGNAIVYTLANGTNLPGTLVLYQNGTIMGETPNAIVDTDYPFQVKAEEAPAHVAYRDFYITVTHNYPPEWVTPAGNIGTVLGGLEFTGAIVASDANLDDTIQYSFVSGQLPPGIDLEPSGAFSGALSLIPANTDYTFVANATDGVYTIQRQFMISGLLNHPPVFTPNSGTHLGTQREGTFFSTNIVATDPDGLGIEEREFPGLPPELVYNPLTGDLEGNIPIYNMNTTINFQYIANDGVLESTANYTIGVLFDSPPTFITPSLPLAVESQDYGALIVATANGDPIFFSIDSGALPIGINLLANGVITGTAPSTDENQLYTFTVRAATSTKSSTKEYSINLVKNIPPVWDTESQLQPNVLETKFQSYTLEAHDENQLQISYSFQGGMLPLDWTFNPNAGANTATVSGIAPVVTEDTEYSFMIGASNGYIRTDRTFKLMVKNNVPPVWTTQSGVIANVVEQTNMPLTLVSATDPEGNTVTYAMNTVTHSWPGWLTLVQANGALYGTAPSVLSNTSVIFTIDASDSTLAAPRDFTINVIHDTTKFDPWANTNVFHTHMDGDGNDITQYPARTVFQNNSMGFPTGNKMFGSASAEAAGPNFLRYSYSTDFELNVPEWTVEFWAYPTSAAGPQGWLHLGGSGAFAGFWDVGISSGGQWTFSGWMPSSTQSINFGSVILNQWQHVAVSRANNGVIRGFLNGVPGVTTVNAAVAATSASEDFFIGASNGGFMYGNIDEVRISRKGRYTSNFSNALPSSAFPMAPVWNTPANGTVLATGNENTSVSSPTPVQAIDLNQTGTFTYQITSASPFVYAISGNSGILSGQFPSLVTDANYPVPTVAKDANGNYSKPRIFAVKSNPTASPNLKLSWRMNRPVGATDFSPSTGTLVSGQPTIDLATLSNGAVVGTQPSYAVAPAPHNSETAWWSGTDKSQMYWNTGTGNFGFLAGTFTFEMWVYMNTYPPASTNPTFFTMIGTNGNEFRLFRFGAGSGSTGRITMGYNNVPGATASAIGSDLVTGQWQHIAVTRDGSSRNIRLWLNGIGGTISTTGSVGASFFDNKTLIINGEITQAQGLAGPYMLPNIYYHSIMFWDVLKYTGNFTPVWPGY